MIHRSLILLCTLAIIAFVSGGSTANEYKEKDIVPVLVNNVGPFHNPAESYSYYSLFPFCQVKAKEEGEGNLGEVLAGDRRELSLYETFFKIESPWRTACHATLTQDDIKAFRDAVQDHYIFEMFVDDLPVKGFIGEMEESVTHFGSHEHNETHFYLFTHLDFSIAYNGNHVIAVNLTTDPQKRIELTYGKNIEASFSYSTHFIETDIPWIDRYTLHSKSLIGEQAVQIHWLSIINSFVLVILLVAFLAVILMRILKKDFARSIELDDEEIDAEDAQDEVGWKLVHGDVFRFPSHIMLFSSFIGTGSQIFALVGSILILSLVGTFYPGNRGGLYSAAVILYALTAGIAGYVSTRLYMSLGGTKWMTNAVMTALVFAVPFLGIFVVLNLIAWYYGSSTALPLSYICVIILLWALVTFPLTILGAIRGRASAQPFDAPCKTNRVESVIPAIPWYRHSILQLLIAGFLPFSAIYIELHYIFAAVWGHRVYTLFGILSVAFVMLVLVTAFITIALTYFQLAAGDYRWWWRSFLSGCATGVFMYCYAVFYYYYRSEMNGVLQGAFFFGYTLMIAYGFALMLGSIAYFMACNFVRYIYRFIKID